VVPLVTCEIDGRLHAVVNVNALDDQARARLRTAPVSFDGEELEARVARRERNWIATVRVRAGQSSVTAGTRRGR
jgi:hypothetical protein